jgi:hypothetical protein
LFLIPEAHLLAAIKRGCHFFCSSNSFKFKLMMPHFSGYKNKTMHREVKMSTEVTYVKTPKGIRPPGVSTIIGSMRLMMACFSRLLASPIW